MKSFLLLLTFYCFFLPKPTFAADKFWPIQSIDTMKYSRDGARDPKVASMSATLVAKIADLHANYISIATPYDEEFYPVLKQWVSAARDNHLHVWFRGNFSGWEGWFGYPKFSDPTIHNQLTKNFILAHPDLFADGDIFTPVPEPENGGFGDPRSSDTVKQAFLQFLPASYQNCVDAFSQISIAVKCGYFSVNGDIARDILTPEVISKTGGVVVIDHYVATPEKLAADVASLSEKYQVPIILGEFGAPIPDINGTMTDEAQRDFIEKVMTLVAKLGSAVGGVNYWTAYGGSTQIFDEQFAPKPAAQVISAFFDPFMYRAQITGLFHRPLVDATIEGDWVHTHTDRNGRFTLLSPQSTISFTVSAPDYKSQTIERRLSQKMINDRIQLIFSLEDFVKKFLKKNR